MNSKTFANLVVFVGLFLVGGAPAAPNHDEAQLWKLVQDAARSALLDPKLVWAVVQVESRGKDRVSPKGARGLMQVMPTSSNSCEIHNVHHSVSNLVGASQCLRKLKSRYRSNTRLALAAYNAGPGNVDKYRGIPPFEETIRYVNEIMRLYDSYRKSPPVVSQVRR